MKYNSQNNKTKKEEMQFHKMMAGPSQLCYGEKWIPNKKFGSK